MQNMHIAYRNDYSITWENRGCKKDYRRILGSWACPSNYNITFDTVNYSIVNKKKGLTVYYKYAYF